MTSSTLSEKGKVKLSQPELERIRPLLEDLEDRIDPEIEDRLFAEWVEFCKGNYSDGIFSPKREKPAPPKVNWPEVTVNQAIEDPSAMAIQQLSGCSQNLVAGAGTLLNVRCNYGTGILASIFGASIFMMDEEMNTLPTARALENPGEVLTSQLENGIPDLYASLGRKTFEMAVIFRDLFNDYPKISRYVHLYHPDIQGPMDICELLWGSSIFVDLYDRSDLIKKVLGLITDTYTAFMKEWEKLVPSAGEFSVHWGLMHRGRIMIRDDSAMNLSPEMFDEFIRPYDQRLLHEFDGGAIHFCGRGDHYIKSMCEMQGLSAINLSQPEYNDMETIYQNTVDRGIRLIGFSRERAEKDMAAGRTFSGNLHSR